MNLVPTAITNTIARNTLQLQKSSPHLLFAAGVTGTIVSTVLACRATLKMDEVLEQAQTEMNNAKTLVHPDYSEADRVKDIKIIRARTGVAVVKLYTPAIIVGGLSIAALTSSHQILTKRNAALTAAYAALDKGFAEYRARVIEKYGEDQDRDFRYGTEQVAITSDSGKKKIVTRAGPNAASIYARFFDEGSPNWSPEPEYNLLFLKCQQNYLNDMLHARGHLFLNEAYDALGIPRTKAGSVVGWVLSRNGATDNYIDFGIFDGKTERIRDFVNGHESSVLIDFNVDGIIWDRIEEIAQEIAENMS